MNTTDRAAFSFYQLLLLVLKRQFDRSRDQELWDQYGASREHVHLQKDSLCLLLQTRDIPELDTILNSTIEAPCV